MTPTPESTDRLAASLRDILGASNVRTNEGLARYTTWRVGGTAAILCVARDAETLARAVTLVRASGLPLLVLGRGSNVLIDDAGVKGVVIVNRGSALTIDGARVRAESGVLLSVLARQTVASGLVGLEWCHDIPGSVGGAVVNNAGANGGQMADVLQSVTVSPPEGPRQQLQAEDLSFGYRRSTLRADVPQVASGVPVVLEAQFELQRGDVTEIKKHMASQRERRKATQPGGASAGSVFKNPPGDSAGRLVESVGLKGMQSGAAAISTLHANFIVNGPHATARDVLRLISAARLRVREECGVTLTPEVQFVSSEGIIGPPPLEDV